MMSESIGKFQIKKTLVKEGNGKKPAFEIGAKATFHFRTILPYKNKVCCFDSLNT